MENLAQYKSQLRDLLPEKGGIFVVDSLLEKLPEQSSHYNALISLKKRYKDLKINSISGILTADEQGRLEAVLDKQTLELIQILEAGDFDRAARRSQLTDKQKIRRGHVLYRVPKEMQLQEEYRCLVRIAFDEEMVLEDLEMDEDTALKSGVRISQYMKVEIRDPNADPVFEIRSRSEPVQFIDEDDFTEWRFFVKPLKAGKHMLELTVTIIQRINGEDRVRERTLEESVVIITEPVPEPDESLPWQRDEETLAMPIALHTITPKSSSVGGWMRNGAMSVALLLAISSAVYAFGPSSFGEQVDWLKARYLQDTEKGYNNFLKKHPKGEHKETAHFKRAQTIIRDQPEEAGRAAEALATYVDDYGATGQHAEEVYWLLAGLTQLPDYFFHYLAIDGPRAHDEAAQQALAALESSFWAKISMSPSAVNLDRYLRLYPKGEYRESIITQLADSASWQRAAVLPLGTLRDTAGWRQRLLTYADELTGDNAGLAQRLRRWAQRGQLPAVTGQVPSVIRTTTNNGEERDPASITNGDDPLTANQGSSGAVEGATTNGETTNAGGNNEGMDTETNFSETSSENANMSNGQTGVSGESSPGNATTDLSGNNAASSTGSNPPGSSVSSGTTNGTNQAPPANPTAGDAATNTPTATGQSPANSTQTGSSGANTGTNSTATASTSESGGATNTTTESTNSSGPQRSANPTVKAIADDLVRIAGGTFLMGCQEESDPNCKAQELPVREVQVSTFYLSKHEVTQAQWQAVMGANPSFNSGCDQCPVEQVSWNDVQAFLKALKAQTGRNYRLPSEAEWEYAARGGSESKDYVYSGGNKIGAVGWFQGNSRRGNPYGSQKTTWPVGKLKANALGLFDLSGNVREWVQDCWHETYEQAPTTGKAWLRSQAGDCSHRVLRGGSWGNGARDCRVSARVRILKDERLINYGFRLARD